MSSAAEVLVVILSIFLALFLLLGVILAIYLIKLTKEIREVTKSAERTVGSVETFISSVTKVASPIFIAEIIAKAFKKSKKESEDK